MKKVLSLLGLLALISFTSPVYAHSGGHNNGGMHGAHRIHASHREHVNHLAPPPPRPFYGTSVIINKGFPRQCYYGFGNYYDNCFQRISRYDGFYYYPAGYYGNSGVHINLGIPIRF